MIRESDNVRMTRTLITNSNHPFMSEQDYSSDYNENSFWDKIKQTAKIVGREIVEKVLTMYFAVKDSDTPLWARTILIGAMGYFIAPIDAIPDVIPFAGYSDDAGAIAMALGAVAMHIKPAHTAAAKAKADEWFS